jgi:hypothetical protein
MADMRHELSILTNDGWVVTLVSDKEISIGDATIASVIVQPVDEYGKHVTDWHGKNSICRKEIRMGRA